MTPTTIAAGWVLIGVSLIVLGAGILLVARSVWAERRATPKAEVIRRINIVSAGGDANSLDVLLAELLTEVPGQRGPSRWS